MNAKAKIFLGYAREDEEKVEDLYQKLSDVGFKPWMDTKDILPGERWKSSIQKAIRRSDFFLVCLSVNSVSKRGFIQREIRDALDVWQEKLGDDIYLIPVRLEDCEVPESLCDFQWVNLFEEAGWTRLIKAIQAGMERWAEVIKPVVQESMPLLSPESSTPMSHLLSLRRALRSHENWIPFDAMQELAYDRSVPATIILYEEALDDALSERNAGFGAGGLVEIGSAAAPWLYRLLTHEDDRVVRNAFEALIHHHGDMMTEWLARDLVLDTVEALIEVGDWSACERRLREAIIGDKYAAQLEEVLHYASEAIRFRAKHESFFPASHYPKEPS